MKPACVPVRPSVGNLPSNNNAQKQPPIDQPLHLRGRPLVPTHPTTPTQQPPTGPCTCTTVRSVPPHQTELDLHQPLAATPRGAATPFCELRDLNRVPNKPSPPAVRTCAVISFLSLPLAAPSFLLSFFSLSHRILIQRFTSASALLFVAFSCLFPLLFLSLSHLQCANNTAPGKAEGGRIDRCPKALAGPPEEGRRLGDS